MTKSKDQSATEAEEFQPFDIEVEQSVLGAILADPRQLAVVLAELVPDDFYDPLHARIFERMILFDDDARAITAVTLGSSLKNDPAGRDLAEARNNVDWRDRQDRQDVDAQTAIREYLQGVSRAAPSSPNLPDYCRIIREHHERRLARYAVEDAATELWRGDAPLDAVARVVDIADKITLRMQHARGSAAAGDAFIDLSRDVEKAVNGGKLPGISTGMSKLDRVLGGCMPGDFLVLAGRPGMGKSALGVQLAKNVAAHIDDHQEREHDVMIFSLEMTAKENVARMIAELDYDDAIRTGRQPLHYSKIIKGRLSTDEFERFYLLGQMLQDFGIEIYDESRMTMQKIAALSRAKSQLSRRKPFVLIDHLHIVGASSTYRGSRIDELTEISGSCKALAKRLQAPVIGLAQLSRSVESREDKRPLLSDLRESGSIEQDADGVLFLYRPEYYLRREVRHAKAKGTKNALEIELKADAAIGELDVNVEKNRSGATGDVRLWIDVASNAVRDAKPERGGAAQLSLSDRFSEPLDGLNDLQNRTGE